MRKAIISVVVLGLALAGATAQAGVITFQYSSAYTGATPSSPAPWLTATLTDVANGVEVHLQANDLPEGVFVSNWLFNLDSGLAGQASVEWLSGVPGVGTIDVDKQNGAAENKFDLDFAFATSNGGDRLEGSKNAAFLVRWVGPPDPTLPLGPASLLSTLSPLTVESFLFTTPKGGVMTGAHIQGLPGQPGSGWVQGTQAQVPENPVPEPGTLLLVGSGLLGLARLRRRRRS